MSTTDEEKTDAPISRRKRVLRHVLLIAIPLAFIVVATLVMIFGGRYVSTENAYIGAPLVNVTPEVSGQISKVLVRENEPVTRGDLMLQIDPSPYRIAVKRAKAQLSQATNSIETLKASYATRKEELSLAEQNVDFTKRELARQQKLAKRNLTSRSELEKYRHNYRTAQRNRDATKQDLKRIAVSLGGDVKSPVKEHPDYQAALANLESARLDLAHTGIHAPFDGIAAKTPDPGTYARVGSPAMSLVGDQQLWIDANFKETDLTRVTPGQSVSIEVDTYPDKEFHGTVQSISQATGAEFSVLPAQNATGNWVKVVQRIPVRIRLDKKALAAGLRSGMSTSVEIDTGYPSNDFPLVGWFRGLMPQASAAEKTPE